MRTLSATPAGLLAGALALAIPGAAAVPAAAQTEAPQAAPAPGTPAPMTPATTTTPAAERTRIGVRSRRLHVKVGRRIAVTGAVRPGVRGVPIVLQAKYRGTWRTLDRGRTRAGGRYVLALRRRATLSAPVRVRVLDRPGIRAARRPLGRVNVYRVALASWYGPGLYGNPLGCGGRLTYDRLGVAHKSLPCGTRVTFRHRGRSVRVAVIDRGPYVGAREYDLTGATARRLGFQGSGAILTTR